MDPFTSPHPGASTLRPPDICVCVLIARVEGGDTKNGDKACRVSEFMQVLLFGRATRDAVLEAEATLGGGRSNVQHWLMAGPMSNIQFQ